VEAVTTSTEVKSTATALNATVSDLKVSNEVLKDTVAGGGQARGQQGQRKKGPFPSVTRASPSRRAVSSRQKPFSARARHNRM